MLRNWDQPDREPGRETGTEPNIVDDASRKLHQTWRRDQAGNWREWQRKEFLSPLQELDQEQIRDHSTANDILRFSTTVWPSPVYDTAGQMTQMPQPGAPESAAKVRYDAWGRLTSYTDSEGVKTEFEYDGLGRRIIQRSAGEERHFYHDQAGRVISEMVQEGDQKRVSREYIWNPNHAEQLVCRLRYQPNTPEPERLYPLHDMHGCVTALVDKDGAVKERYAYDAQGHITYLNADFSKKTVQQSLYAWEYFVGGLRFDRVTQLHFIGAGYYHADLGRPLPGGAIGVLPESAVNEYAADFPFGAVRPAGIMGRQSTERFFKWVGEQSPWLKFTIGAVAMTVTVGVLVAGGLSGGPAVTLPAIGALCGAIQGGVGAGLSGGDYGDVMLGAGLGAAFGAVCPLGGIGSLAGSGIGFGAAMLARGAGEEWVTLSMGWEWGGLIGGMAGNFSGLTSAAKAAGQRSLVPGFIGLGADLIGGGAGAYIGFNASGGDLNCALHGATMGMMGMMAANLSGAAVRGLWGVERAVAQGRGINRGLKKTVLGLNSRGEETLAFRDLASGAKRLVRQLSGTNRAFVGKRVHIDHLRQASLYLERELGVVLDRKGRLTVIKGVLDSLPSRPGDRFLVHTHPVFNTVPDDFLRYDIPNATDSIEAVIDWGGTITYFNRTGILQDLRGFSGPINSLGFITGY